MALVVGGTLPPICNIASRGPKILAIVHSILLCIQKQVDHINGLPQLHTLSNGSSY